MNQPENPWAPLGLPAMFQPSPLAWRWAKVKQSTPAGIVETHLLIIETAIGRSAYAFPGETFRAFVDSAIKERTGLAVASSVPMKGDTNGRS